MKILIIGSGGREHAISMALSKNSNNNMIYAMPGNPGMLEYCECVNIDQLQFDEIISFIKKNSIDLVIIGPEVPICEGLTDIIEDVGVKVFAPNKLASVLESSKKFTKEISFLFFSSGTKRRTGIVKTAHHVPTEIRDNLAAVSGSEIPNDCGYWYIRILITNKTPPPA